jgi:hypothetical protein
MNSGTAAAATVSATKQATAPTLVHTASQVTNKTQIAVSPRTGTSDISKYYIAVTANAPATSFNDITKTINTVGYLGDADQITASASTSANNTLYYVPISTGGVTISGSTQATAPTAANNSSASVNGKTKIAAAPTTDTNTIDTYYMAIKVNAPATTISLSKSVTSGYISADSEVTASAGTSAKSSTYYIPITSTSLVKGSGVASASSGNVALTSNGTT